MIERTEDIRFHEEGTLRAVTRWVTGHDEGISELFKNVRRAYQADRLDVADEHRAAVLLIKDGDPRRGLPAFVGVLDVGGATLDDAEAWSVWDDPDASGRGSDLREEETQGNGGKAYLYAWFTGQCRILGVSSGRRNCKGFEGPHGSVERGTPGWIPSVAEGREVDIVSLDAELRAAVEPYGVTPADLPEQVLDAIQAREAFTLVEGTGAMRLYKDRFDVEDLVVKVLRHEQMTLVLDQVAVYGLHNGGPIYDGKPLQLPSITPYPGLEAPQIFAIPELLELTNGEKVSTTESGVKPAGRLLLYTSRDNMHAAYRNLRPRWRVSYRTSHQMIGSKSVGELVPGASGGVYIYGRLELPALEPGYVETGRKRPKDGPLVEALDRFVGEKIRELAKKINDLRKQELDEASLDEIHDENRRLDRFKNSFLPSDRGIGGSGDEQDQDEGIDTPLVIVDRQSGTEPYQLVYALPEDGILIAKGIQAHMPYVLHAKVVDDAGRSVPMAKLEWFSSDPKVANLEGQTVTALESGKCEVWIRVVGTDIESAQIPLEVWSVDHVFLAPRELTLAVGKRSQITAEVTDEDGRRSSRVLLEWQHDADDQLIVRMGPRGRLTANREGRTSVVAGAGDVWARRAVEVTVTAPESEQGHAGGYPKLMLTDRDVDPATGQIREGNPDMPSLWQEPADYVNNVYWLNLQSPEAASAFLKRSEVPEVWRMFHVGKLVEMVEYVWMDYEYTNKGDSERPDYWANHRSTHQDYQVTVLQDMWPGLEDYVRAGSLEEEA
jgi:hypothetical protein